MKKQLFLLAGLFLISLSLLSQSKVNLVVFSEDGDPFYMYVNGIRQNDKPETNVKVTNLSPNISLRIVFENKALPELKQPMALEPGFEHTARIKRDMKKQLKLRYFGQSPLSDEPTPGVTTVAYHTSENAVAAETPASGSAGINQSHQTTVTSSTTTTKKGNGAASENVSVNINVSGIGMNMNVSGMDDNNATVHTTSSTTVTSSSSSSGSFQENTASSQAAVASEPARSGCNGAMSTANFSNLKKSVESKPFSDTKMSTAKVATKNACLSVNQVKEICQLFSMDEEKLTFAKYAYERCVDKANYYQVSEVFSFSSTTDEFNSFLEQ